MLRLLADNEAGIRRSMSPRLVVETLLLRWAMMDRIVDLEQVIKAGQRGSGAAGQGGEVLSGQGSEPAPREGRSCRTHCPVPGPRGRTSSGPAAPRPRGPPCLLPSTPSAPPGPRSIAAVRVHSRFLSEALAATEPAELELPWLGVVMREPNQLFAERLHQEAAKVEEILSRSLGQPVRLRVTAAPAGAQSPPAKPRRMSESTLKAERLREFRAKDPALDTAADALDLEIVD